jgi:hypothetical protein
MDGDALPGAPRVNNDEDNVFGAPPVDWASNDFTTFIESLQNLPEIQVQATKKNATKRKYNTTMKSVVRKAAKLKAEAKAAKKYALGNCTLQNWSGRQPHDPVYSPLLIQQLRIYFNRLGKVDQLAFIGPGGRCDETNPNPADGNYAFKSVLCNYRLEAPLILGNALLQAQISGRTIPIPVAENCVSVRQKFLHWAVGCSVSRTHRWDPRHRSNQMPKSFDQRKFKGQPLRREDKSKRATEMQPIMEQWMQLQREEHLTVWLCVLLRGVLLRVHVCMYWWCVWASSTCAYSVCLCVCCRCPMAPTRSLRTTACWRCTLCM